MNARAFQQPSGDAERVARAHDQACKLSTDGQAHHVCYSPRSGPVVLTAWQANAFKHHVHIDATYVSGVRICLGVAS